MIKSMLNYFTKRRTFKAATIIAASMVAAAIAVQQATKDDEDVEEVDFNNIAEESIRLAQTIKNQLK